MAEEKKGRVKVTIDVEVNEALMDMAKKCVANMPKMFAKIKEKRQE
jgi:hypothetical protein